MFLEWGGALQVERRMREYQGDRRRGARCRRRRGCGVWRGGVPLPNEGGLWGGGCTPSPENFKLSGSK